MYMNLLEGDMASHKKSDFFIPDMENTRSELSYVIKSDPVANVQNGLNSGTKKNIFSKIHISGPCFRFRQMRCTVIVYG